MAYYARQSRDQIVHALLPAAPNKSVNWENWAKTFSCTPRAVFVPRNVHECRLALELARRDCRVLRPVGIGHSPSDVACTRDYMLNMTSMNAVLEVNAPARYVVAQAGITLTDLHAALASHGLAMRNLGSISDQTLAGIVATATHGSGIHFGVMSTHVLALTLLLPSNEIVHCSRDPPRNVRLFEATVCGLGATGLILDIKLEVEKAFCLREEHSVRPFGEVVERLDELKREGEHVRLWWFPAVGSVRCMVSSRTSLPAAPKPSWFWDSFFGFHAVQLLLLLTRFARPLPRPSFPSFPSSSSSSSSQSSNSSSNSSSSSAASSSPPPPSSSEASEAPSNNTSSTPSSTSTSTFLPLFRLLYRFSSFAFIWASLLAFSFSFSFTALFTYLLTYISQYPKYIYDYAAYLTSHPLAHLTRDAHVWAARLACWLAGGKEGEKSVIVDESVRVFNVECRYPQHTTEWALPSACAGPCLEALGRWLEGEGGRVQGERPHFPIEIRFSAGDDLWLSPSSGGETCWIGIVQYKPYNLPTRYRALFAEFERILAEHGGRPHWAKAHHLDARQTRALYPQFGKFLEVVREVDPEGIFRNEYIERHLMGGGGDGREYKTRRLPVGDGLVRSFGGVDADSDSDSDSRSIDSGHSDGVESEDTEASWWTWLKPTPTRDWCTDWRLAPPEEEIRRTRERRARLLERSVMICAEAEPCEEDGSSSSDGDGDSESDATLAGSVSVSMPDAKEDHDAVLRFRLRHAYTGVAKNEPADEDEDSDSLAEKHPARTFRTLEKIE